MRFKKNIVIHSIFLAIFFAPASVMAAECKLELEIKNSLPLSRSILITNMDAFVFPTKVAWKKFKTKYASLHGKPSIGEGKTVIDQYGAMKAKDLLSGKNISIKNKKSNTVKKTIHVNKKSAYPVIIKLEGITTDLKGKKKTLYYMFSSQCNRKKTTTMKRKLL